jgi:hypothetical protein
MTESQIVWILEITGFGYGDDWCKKCAQSANGLLTIVAWSVSFVGLLIRMLQSGPMTVMQ